MADGRPPAGRCLVVGASGLVGRALMRALDGRGREATGTCHRQAAGDLLPLDVADRAAVAATIGRLRPAAVLLTAAWADVDGCERDPERARLVNVEGAANVADACAKVDAALVHYSTDYVFDGAAGPYGEEAEPRPVNVYGETKLQAERVVRARCPRHLVIRTTGVFGWEPRSMNFAMQLWRRLSAGQELAVPVDQVSTPTLADYLAEVTLRLLEDGRDGVVNVVGRDRLSRFDLACRLARAFALDPAPLRPVPTGELGQAAARPLGGGLRTERLERLLGTEAMSLDEALKRVRRRWRASTHVTPDASAAGSGSEADTLKREILASVRAYHRVAHRPAEFVPSASRVQYAGRVFGPEELVNLVDAGLDFWLTLGPWGERFELGLRDRLGARDVVMVSSGSSANLLAVASLVAPNRPDGLRPGDEVITPAVTFPTTLAPLLQHGLAPVLVDCQPGTYNLDPACVAEAVGPRTRAIVAPHTLGNPFDLDAVCAIARRHGLLLVEDCCDALGSTFAGRPVGTFGDVATLSFFPAHHITTGEGGAVIASRPGLGRVLRSLRDWGRDCWCAPGESNTCGRRFGWALGDLPAGYDHKYTYSHVGYNLKPTDLQAAIGVAQLDRLDDFVARRRANFALLHEGLRPFQDRLLLPERHPSAEPAWFGFPVTVRDGRGRRPLVQWLEEANIETRDVFGGHILRQPAYREVGLRCHGDLAVSEEVLEQAFFVGVYPGLTADMIQYVVETFEAYFGK